MRRVLVVSAHPDDADFACGGTIAALVAQGDRVSLLVATSGEAGLPVGEVDTSLRRREQQAAAAVLGVSSVDFLDHPDGGVRPSPDLRRDITASIRALRPDLLITHSPRRNLRGLRSSHPDHTAVGEAALSAVYPDARNPRSYGDLLDQGLEPYVVPEVWLHGTEECDWPVDIRAWFATKVRAVRCHESQLAGAGSDVEEFLRNWGREVAQQHNLGADNLAEEFLRLDTR
ncbi:PIG-L deacetylase family protein [Verrucosispora sp. WMMD573]|uniref:PIG-L deacetylase family protein n=1 Tax=Verrucosispora sp. WMMD573 TaxID=3015149 RepID=UPI00248A9D70|nr:PIG-L deacetylase family protein [Verrucosispora sp. WMMD573]WBB53735.1 PIG-L family deacetylase [Verrucosispora sp. WMMD573]